ncbi:MAG: hypothetical protein [Caudoviricetes sp.]|nr:MAG: hypothetical protein [Caudoviricetes sp.]
MTKTELNNELKKLGYGSMRMGISNKIFKQGGKIVKGIFLGVSNDYSKIDPMRTLESIGRKLGKYENSYGNHIVRVEGFKILMTLNKVNMGSDYYYATFEIKKD